jgi:hypothetical protein
LGFIFFVVGCFLWFVELVLPDAQQLFQHTSSSAMSVLAAAGSAFNKQPAPSFRMGLLTIMPGKCSAGLSWFIFRS